MWEAADLQCWWRRRRQTDDRPLPVRFDELGPCRAAVLTDASLTGFPRQSATPHGDTKRRPIEARLRQCSLYDPALDLAVYTPSGDAGLRLVLVRRATGVGMFEPLRVEEAHQRQGLARAVITDGLNRLVRRGAQRLKVGFNTDAGRSLYVSSGFSTTSAIRSFSR